MAAMTPKRRRFRAAALAAGAAAIAAAQILLCERYADGIAPGHLTDEELARFPLIVVARWNRAPFEAHHRIEQNALRDYDLRTRIEVIRVIRGDLEPGEHTVMLDFGIGWEETGGQVMSYTSTQLGGDAEEVLKPNLWFLTRKRTWDAADKTEYLHVPHYRAIQPSELEPFYLALRSEDGRREIPKLLASESAEVVRRTLLHVCGGVWPWPNDEHFQRTYLSPRDPGERLVEQKDAVARLVPGGDPKVAWVAASVYADLAAKESVTRMREWLHSGDPRVRAVAMGILSRQRDGSSIEAMAKAVEGMEDPWLSSRVIGSMKGWREVSLVPVLLTFLEDDSDAGCEGDDFKIPALRARFALHALTCRWFPFDVELSRRAWEAAIGPRAGPEPPRIPDGLLPYGETPFEAALVREGERTFVRVKNRSEVAIALAKRPSQITYRSDTGLSDRYEAASAERGAFQVLSPREAILFEVKAPRSFLSAIERKLTLHYLKTGRAIGLKAWIGALEVDLGEARGDGK
jgi:hypothetical protein